jgi:hypothetical protein
VDLATDAFRSYWKSGSGVKFRKTDWQATWRNHMAERAWKFKKTSRPVQAIRPAPMSEE